MRRVCASILCADSEGWVGDLHSWGPGIRPNPTLYRIRPNPESSLIGSKCPYRLQNTPKKCPAGLLGIRPNSTLNRIRPNPETPSQANSEGTPCAALPPDAESLSPSPAPSPPPPPPPRPRTTPPLPLSPPPRGLHLFTSQINSSAFYGTRGTRRGSARFEGVLGGCIRCVGCFCVSDTAQVELRSERV